MKTSKRRIAVSIITAFMMVFAVIPYMGPGIVNADTNLYEIKKQQHLDVRLNKLILPYMVTKLTIWM